jgi:lysophospholipase L1-like esterase
MAPYNKVKILETGQEREYLTKHGLHLNSSGKECIAQRLAMVVKSSDQSELDHAKSVRLSQPVPAPMD